MIDAMPPQVLVIERTYDGPIERAGEIFAWRYAAPYMILEFGDRRADGIFRDGFEARVHRARVSPACASPSSPEACP